MQDTTSYPITSDQIEPDHAKHLYEHCAILVLENMPLGSEFGIDLFAFRTGEKFKGIKMIPPGIHFIYASATDKKTHQCGPRTGFFYNFKPKELLIKKWSVIDEDFDDSYSASEEQRHRYQSNLRDLDSYLGAYQFSTYKSFLNLTNKISHSEMKRLMPNCNRIRSVPYLVRDTNDDDSLNNKTTHKAAITKQISRDAANLREEKLLPDLKPHNATIIHYTKIFDKPSDAKLMKIQNLSESLITQYNLDTSMKMEQSFPGEEGKDRLLCEIQFSFATFLMCHVYDCFEHWKKLLHLVCLADSNLESFPLFYTGFAEILSNQLKHVPEDLFEDIVDSNNLVRTLLDTLFQNVQDCPRKDQNLLKNIERLKELTVEKFGWQYELERDDEQPVIVEL